MDLPRRDHAGRQGGELGGGRRGAERADQAGPPEDGFSAGVAQYLNKQVLEGGIVNLVVISAPRSLGELRKHYHKFLSAKLLLEIPKDLTGHSAQDVEKAVQATDDVYRRTVFPEMNVQFGTYPNNIGHMDFPGCFRCHDDNHKAKDGKKIAQDCDTCHTIS